MVKDGELSERVVRVARELDRLPPGDYNVRIVKPDLSGMAWHVEIHRVDRVNVLDLDKREK